MTLLFSIIIPTCDRVASLGLCLNKLAAGKQSLDAAQYEVIVTDDGKIHAKDFVKENYPWVKWIQGPSKGPAANRNNGARHASGKWLVFTDDDCLPEVHLLKEYKEAINKSITIKAFEGAILPLGNMNKDFAECPANISGGLFWSANVCIQRELFWKAGGFDEHYRIAAQEDQDLHLRIKKYTEIIFVKYAQVSHPVRYISFMNSILKIQERSLNWSYFASKNKMELGYKNNFGIIRAAYSSQIRSFYNALKRGFLGQLCYSIGMLLYGIPLIHIFLIKGLLENRKFKWISSKTGDRTIVDKVNQRLSAYYSQTDWRQTYQKMLDDREPLPSKEDFSYLILDYIMNKKPNTILDLGCGNGRIYRHLKQLGFSGKYTGTEVAPYLIDANKMRHPEAAWILSDAYAIPAETEQFDHCFAFFVLEHLVYPEKALMEMMRIIKTNGSLVLIFPDFIASGRLSSQQLGFSPNDTFIQKLKKGKIMDSLVSIYDSRIRLPRALKRAHIEVGDFPINTNLVCFNHPEKMSPDFDAVYIASKREIEKWAVANGYKVSFPYGNKGELNEKAFLVITK